MATMESPYANPESPMDMEDVPYPCKGCGEILEEGKAFELAGHRWHINCFRCSICSTLLDSDANLLLLGDGSLICNNCTYSCSGCGNKIEDLAILTGDQAFCATCFRCRNCKQKIENLKYARTSQGIFCMNCHEALMARRRKRPKGSSRSKSNAQLDKSLPAIPPPEARKTAYMPAGESNMYSDAYAQQVSEAPSVSRTISELRPEPDSDSSRPPTSSQNHPPGPSLTLPSTAYKNNRHSYMSAQSDLSGAGGEEFLIPLAFDPTPVREHPPASSQSTPRGTEERPGDYFNRSNSQPILSNTSHGISPRAMYKENGRMKSHDGVEKGQHQAQESISRSGPAAALPFMPPDKFSKQQMQEPEPPPSSSTRTEEAKDDRFRLQDPPKKGGFTAVIENNSGSGRSTPRAETYDEKSKAPVSQESETLSNRTYSTPDPSKESSPRSSDIVDSPKQSLNAPPALFSSLPKRGDSLESTKRTIPRKEIGTITTTPSAFAEQNKDVTSSPRASDLAKVNGGKLISAPIASPASQSMFDAPNAPQFQSDSDKGTESFVDPRAPPPPPPPEYARSRTGSVATQQSEQKYADGQKSPKLPRWSGAGDFTLEEDMARILGDEPQAHESFLRRVSNSVRHGRSYSAQSGRTTRDRFPKSPIAGGSLSGQDISSPTSASPEHREELAWFKNQLKVEREKNVARERKIAELEAQLDQSASIKQVNSELKEKRSTMVVLDTQKEIVVRELEVLTEHLARAKTSKEPFDLPTMSNSVLREFAEALEELKNSFTPQIEEFVEKRNSLLEEITRLTTVKEKSFAEFEQLSSKNAQLAELNNQLVHQIQDIYKSNQGPAQEPNRSPAPNGLGIYSHHKDKSQVSLESRETKPTASEVSIAESGTTLQGDAEPITVIGGPNVVSIKKINQPKKFDWRKGQKVAKGITKGVKGAFSSTQQSYNRDMQFAETGAYGQMAQSQEYGPVPRNNTEPVKQGFGFFSGNQKPPVKGNGLYVTPQANTSTPSIGLDPSTNLFGSDLEQRAEYEKTNVPAIVKRCIEEVETRGMDVEGIYRKSGGNSQVQQVKESFERPSHDYDISDPDLDIHAVTSGLKQYFRKLPTPLITYDVYDTLLEATSIPEGPSQHAQRIEAMQKSLRELPKVHYDTLDYLVRHLAKVVKLERDNLMTPTNIAVVFAPTIMRPESVSRELTDTKAKNEVVTWMVEDYPKVFARLI